MIQREPVSRRQGLAVYRGDCLELLREIDDASVDLVLTDPPYCAGGYMEAQRGQSQAQGLRTDTAGFRWFAGDNLTTVGLVWLLRAVLVECRRILKPDRSALVFCDWRMIAALAPALESSGLRWRNLIVWDKGSGGLGVGFRPVHECVLEFTNGATEYRRTDATNVIRAARIAGVNKIHPAEKPREVLADLISTCTAPGGLVVDPFAGSGSTLEAARDCGCQAIGIELAPEYAATAAKRIAQGNLFAQEETEQ